MAVAPRLLYPQPGQTYRHNFYLGLWRVVSVDMKSGTVDMVEVAEDGVPILVRRGRVNLTERREMYSSWRLCIPTDV